MKAVVNADECVSCGKCEEICPAVFVLGDDIAEVIGDPVPEDAEESCRKSRRPNRKRCQDDVDRIGKPAGLRHDHHVDSPRRHSSDRCQQELPGTALD